MVFQEYIVEFNDLLTKEKLIKLQYLLKDIRNYDNDLSPVCFETDGSLNDLLDGSASKYYYISPPEAAYYKGYERGDFLEHYFLIRFFLNQSNVKSIYYVDGEYLGSEIKIDDAEELFKYYMDNGHLPNYSGHFDIPLKNHPVHPECWCKKKLACNSNDNGKLVFSCKLNNCERPRIEITDKAAALLLKNGELPSDYIKVETEEDVYWTQKTKAKVVFNKIKNYLSG